MKKTILLLLLVCSQLSIATTLVNLVMPSLPNILMCDENDGNPNNGLALFNLTVQTPIILALQTLASSNYTVSYYTTLSAAQSGIGTIVNSTSFAGSNGQTIYVRVTLANVQVNGQNIQWYSGANKNVNSTPLPLSTVLISNATYFASQKTGGYESTSRLPGLAQVSLSNVEFEWKGLTFSPNPVSDNLNVRNTIPIKSIAVFNLLGQLLMSENGNDSAIQLDLSSLNSGNYFVKITTEFSQNNFRIIKE